MSITISPVFDFSQITNKKDSEVHLDVVLEAPEKDAEKRVPLHLILAIDCSFSMNGEKLNAVKRTVDKLITHLTENDTLGIIGFSDNVFDVFKALPMTNENKTTAKKKIASLVCISSTNLSEAIKISSELATISDNAKVKRIILLTDGLPTSGITDRKELIKLASSMNPSVSMTTFGYGDDYDPELMASVSSMGKGNNFYIKEDSDCPKAFAMELGGLLSLYGQNLKLTINPNEGFVFKELLSEYKCKQVSGYRLLTQSRIEIVIDDIYSGEKKHCVLKLQAPKRPNQTLKVCDINLSYMSVDLKKEETVDTISGITYSDSPQSEPDINVKKQLALLELGRIQKKAQEKADKGHYSEAQQELNRGIDFITNNTEFFINSDAMVNNFKDLSANFVDANSYRSKGVKKSLSLRSSYTTSRGLSTDSFSFVSPVASQTEMLDAFKGDEDTEQV